MRVPFFFHIGNTGGLSLGRAVADMRDLASVLFINAAEDFEQARPRMAPDRIGRIKFALGHAIQLAEPWFPERYEITMLRWPQALFCANSIYAHEHPPHGLPEIDRIADHHERLRAYLAHLERGGAATLKTTGQWLAERHGASGNWDDVLARRYDLVAITELMDESLFLYHAAFPDRAVAPWVRRRENNQRIDPFELPADIVARFERAFAEDIALYERARARLLAAFVALMQAQPQLRERYLDYKAKMILTDVVLMKRFAAADALYFPSQLPLEELRASVIERIGRAAEIRSEIMRACG